MTETAKLVNGVVTPSLLKDLKHKRKSGSVIVGYKGLALKLDYNLTFGRENPG